MLGYQLLYLASLIVFTFGGLTFSVLALYYWRARRLRPRASGPAFPVFTLACAAAFAINLLLQATSARDPDSAWVSALSVTLNLVTALLPPLVFHLVYQEEAGNLPAARMWPWLLRALYAAGVLAATGWLEGTDNVPAILLGVAGGAALGATWLSRRNPGPLEYRHRRWTQLLLCLTVAAAIANLAQPGPLMRLLPDYLLLAFFCVTLYFKERLVFFDMLLKRGAFFAVALVGLTAFFMLAPQNVSGDWSRPWICALLLLPFWLMGPWIFRQLGLWIDRIWLRRRYSAPDAERQFVEDLQTAASEEELQSRAATSLGAIFQTFAVVRFEASRLQVEPNGLLAPLQRDGAPLGWAALAPGPDTIPFLSDDQRLLQSLACTLAVVLENVRFRQQARQQQEREQELRLLATRAELKALRAQIDPHFLFNALNAIAGLIPTQPQKADETVEQLAEVFRYTLRKSEKEWVRLGEELDFVQAYLRVEQARFGERLQVNFDVDGAAGGISIPAMTIQPLIENAVRHGVSAIEGGKVGLRAAVEGGALRIEVLDNGPGFAPGFVLEDAGGHGLRNVAGRIAGYYGNAAHLGWENSARGTRVFWQIPCGTNGNDSHSDRR